MQHKPSNFPSPTKGQKALLAHISTQSPRVAKASFRRSSVSTSHDSRAVAAVPSLGRIGR
jgi:hypothetical protein